MKKSVVINIEDDSKKKQKEGVCFGLQDGENASQKFWQVLLSFKDSCSTHSCANAHGDDSIALASSSQLVQQ